MKRLSASICVALSALLLPLTSEAQTPRKMARIAYVWMFSSGPSAPQLASFRERMRELGWIEGTNLVIDVRDAGGDPLKLAAIMQAEVDSKVDVIVGACTPEGNAAAKVTKTIPIVMAATGDAVAAGLAESLAHPGGNVTGISGMLLELSAKRLSLLKSAFPEVARATVVYNPERSDNGPEVKAMQAAGKGLGIRVDALQVRSRLELSDGLDMLAGGDSQALLNAGDTLVGSQARVIVDYAAKHRLPALYENREYVDAGGLMSYGPNFPALHRRAADYVDKILKGAKPADLPIEQPTKFEFIVNLRAAKSLGLTIPQAVLLQADEIIQ